MEDVQTTHIEVLEPEADRRGDAVAGVIAEKLGKVLRTLPQFSADTTTCTKPLYFGRTIAFMGIGISGAREHSVTVLGRPKSCITQVC